MAADTYTALLGAILMGTGNDNNTWGDFSGTVLPNSHSALTRKDICGLA